ncbi:MAG: putative nucleic acid-binding Zn-ribbon protein [Verrucomicrobiales bacterium]|jgi:predicted  nucleic acid-binding Zn-ribbon protein
MHNMLTTLALIAMIGASVLSFMNKDNLGKAKEDQTAKQNSLEVTESELESSRKTLGGLETQVATAKSEGEKLAGEAETLSSQIETKDTDLETLEGELESAKAEREDQKDKLAKVGDLNEAVKNLESLRVENAALTNSLASLNSQVESGTEASSKLQTQIDGISKQIEDRKSGKLPENFSASVSQVYPKWGFVVIGAGNQQRAAEGAILSVKRGDREIAKLKITDLLQNRSVADVVRGSLASGVQISPGDRVYPTVAK